MNYYPLLSGDNCPETVILADGNFPRHPLARVLLDAAKTVVCCDRAAVALVRHGREPQAIVGDGDSLPEAFCRKYAPLIFRETEQETNDLTKAVRFCLGRGWEDILILGATGKREDHTLGNISLLADYMRQVRVRMLTDYGLFTPVEGDAEFESFPGQQVSVFNMGCTRLKGENLVYPLSVFTNWWQGTLNEATGTTFKIYTDGRLLVYRSSVLS
ncbi:thiamine diphosphokinase [Odoribacter lunatus]|uniref:thiamine diphosphokinase n=1 Tax=Odoribacter lunatus TaxID=2941335 RepID=UPI00203B30FF|nr:thiamine diphosphokinase [Odoribacter lunatus]